MCLHLGQYQAAVWGESIISVGCDALPSRTLDFMLATQDSGQSRCSDNPSADEAHYSGLVDSNSTHEERYNRAPYTSGLLYSYHQHP